MLQDVESTQNLKTTIDKATSWEESLPLPDLGEAAQATVAEPKAPPQIVSVAKKKRFTLNRKIVIVSTTLTIFGVIAGAVANFASPRIQQVSEVRKSRSQISPPGKISFRRLSSAFIPKAPSTEPTNLIVNWEKFEDMPTGLSFFHPEEWRVEKNGDSTIYTLYYPLIAGSKTNFGQEFLAKLSVSQEGKPANLAEFLLKRYNLSNANFAPKGVGQEALEFEFGNTFVFAITSGDRLFILEGKVGKIDEFENFKPIFLNISYSFQILK